MSVYEKNDVVDQCQGYVSNSSLRYRTRKMDIKNNVVFDTKF